MNIDTWLRILANGLPLIGVLALWKWPDKFVSAPRWLATVVLGVSGIIALTLFLLKKHYSCILVTGRQSCLMDGLATSSLFVLNVILVRACMIQRVGMKNYSDEQTRYRDGHRNEGDRK